MTYRAGRSTSSMKSCAQVPLTRGLVAVIDAADLPLVTEFRWHATAVGYAARSTFLPDGRRGVVLMHRYLMDPTEGAEVDHVNGDRLDNRRANLRLCTRVQNQCNVPPNRKNRVGLKGVTLAASGRRWNAQIQVAGENHRIGTYDTPESAARAYDCAAAYFHGEFAYRNFPAEAV